MEKEIAVLEIRSKIATLVIGNLVNGKVNIINKVIKPLSVPLKSGEVLDSNSLTKDIESMLTIEDVEHGVKYTVNEITLILQPYGLNAYQTDRITNIISNQNIIDKKDITNAISMIAKEKIDDSYNNMIVDIVPNSFKIDGDITYNEPPLGQISRELMVSAHIYSLPNLYAQELLNCVANTGVKVTRLVISPIGLSKFLKEKQFKYNTYILVDCGQKSTILTFVGNNIVFKSANFELGIDDLIDKIAFRFNILKAEASDLVNLYGYDNRRTDLNPPIAKYNINGKEYSMKLDDLNSEIVEYFSNWTTKLTQTIQEFKLDPEILRNINLVFINEGININGFKNYIKRFVKYNSEFLVIPDVGLQNSFYANCAGAIYLSSTYTGSSNDDIKGRIREVNREIETNQEYDEVIDEL
ncbi:MAG: hypothetical protein ACTTID_02970 [Bacillales bacterium]